MKSKSKNDKYMGSVKIGSKGQIVIPKKVRDMFQINPGDTLVQNYNLTLISSLEEDLYKIPGK